MSDVTYLMDESLSKLSEIHQIQTEMSNQIAWEQQTPVSDTLAFCYLILSTLYMY